MFSVRNDEDRAFLMVNYFYRGIVAGVNVRSHIERALYESPSIFDYIFDHQMFIGSIEGSLEKVPINTKETSIDTAAQPLQELIKKYYGTVGEDLLDGFKQKEFIEGIYENQPGRDAYVISLREVIFILSHLKRAKLIEEMAIQEKTEYDKVQEEAVPIFVWFFDRELWSKIADYFKKENKLVRLPIFLWYCTYIYDLTQEGAVKKFVDFAEFLQKEGLLPADLDIVEFHEDDSKFHWNQDVVHGLPGEWKI